MAPRVGRNNLYTPSRATKNWKFLHKIYHEIQVLREISLYIYFSVWHGIDQLDARNEYAIRFKTKFLNYFFLDIFPRILLTRKNNGKNKYITDIKARGAFVGGDYIVNNYEAFGEHFGRNSGWLGVLSIWRLRYRRSRLPTVRKNTMGHDER